MINYLQIFIFIMMVVIIKITVFTNKNIKEIMIKTSMALIFTTVVLLIGLNITQPVSRLFDISDEDQQFRMTMNSIEGGMFSQLAESDEDYDIYKSIIHDFDVCYTLKTPKSGQRSPDNIISVIFSYEHEKRIFSLTNTNELHYDNKFYKVTNKDLYGYLVELIEEKSTE